MKKIIIILLVVLSLTFMGCRPTINKTGKAFDTISLASQITQVIEIKQGDTVLSSKNLAFTKNENVFNVKETVTSINYESADSLYSTSEKTYTVDVFSGTGIVFEDTYFKTVAFDSDDDKNYSFSGTIANENIKTVLGIENNSVNGDVDIVVTVSEKLVSTYSISYTSSNNNQVTITTSIVY